MTKRLVASGFLGDYTVEFVKRDESGDIVAQISCIRHGTRYIRTVTERYETKHFSPWRRYEGDVTSLEKV